MSFPVPRTERPRSAGVPAGPVLVFAPRSIDALLGLGGTLALHVAQGDRVQVLVLLAEPGRSAADPPPRSANEGMLLGIHSWEHWRLEGELEGTQDETFALARRLARRLVEADPATLYAPWHGESDAGAFFVSNAAALAVSLADFEGLALGYEIRSLLLPSRVVDVGAVWEHKRAALERCSEELAHPGLARGLAGLAAHRSLELGPGATHGEAFAELLDLRIPVPRANVLSAAPRS